MNTRISNDPVRLAKAWQESVGVGQYHMEVPGWGARPLYLDDPCLRMQTCGGPLAQNAVDLETALRGQHGRAQRGDARANHLAPVGLQTAPSAHRQLCVRQPRQEEPAFLLLGRVEDRTPSFLRFDPQAHLQLPAAQARALDTRQARFQTSSLAPPRAV